MPLNCAIPGCNQSSGRGFNLFKLPNDLETRKEWIQFLIVNKVNYVENKSYALCADHFSSDSFNRKAKRTRLIVGATPNVMKNRFRKVHVRNFSFLAC